MPLSAALLPSILAALWMNSFKDDSGGCASDTADRGCFAGLRGPILQEDMVWPASLLHSMHIGHKGTATCGAARRRLQRTSSCQHFQGGQRAMTSLCSHCMPVPSTAMLTCKIYMCAMCSPQRTETAYAAAHLSLHHRAEHAYLANWSAVESIYPASMCTTQTALSDSLVLKDVGRAQPRLPRPSLSRRSGRTADFAACLVGCAQINSLKITT